MIEYFNLVGKTPEFNDMLIVRHSGELIKGALIFNVFIEISSSPHAFFQGKERIIFLICPVDVLRKTTLGNGRVNI
jgi:ribosomal protein L31